MYSATILKQVSEPSEPPGPPWPNPILALEALALDSGNRDVLNYIPRGMGI